MNDAKDLLNISEPGVISKTRYYVRYAEQLFEVDEFHEGNLGLIVAEIELKHEKSCVQKPKWLGEEVTGISKYYNSSLVNTPFLIILSKIFAHAISNAFFVEILIVD